VPWRSMRNSVIAWLTAISTSTSMWCGDGTGMAAALLQQLPAVRQDADDEDRNDNCERGISDDC
jgi:hypothetical protein